MLGNKKKEKVPSKKPIEYPNSYDISTTETAKFSISKPPYDVTTA